jgi:hypothetical protein
MDLKKFEAKYGSDRKAIFPGAPEKEVEVNIPKLKEPVIQTIDDPEGLANIFYRDFSHSETIPPLSDNSNIKKEILIDDGPDTGVLKNRVKDILEEKTQDPIDYEGFKSLKVEQLSPLKEDVSNPNSLTPVPGKSKKASKLLKLCDAFLKLAADF